VALTHVNFGRTVWKRLLQVLGQRHQTLGHRGQVVSESKLVTVSMTLSGDRKDMHTEVLAVHRGSLVQVVHRLRLPWSLIVLSFQDNALKGIRGGDYFDMLGTGLSMQPDRHMHLTSRRSSHALSSMLWRASSSL
jgi:hypothetical protein